MLFSSDFLPLGDPFSWYWIIAVVIKMVTLNSDYMRQAVEVGSMLRTSNKTRPACNVALCLKLLELRITLWKLVLWQNMELETVVPEYTLTLCKHLYTYTDLAELSSFTLLWVNR